MELVLSEVTVVLSEVTVGLHFKKKIKLAFTGHFGTRKFNIVLTGKMFR